MHDDVTRPEGNLGVEVTLKSKMAAISASSGGNSKMIVLFDPSESSTNRLSRHSTAQPYQNTCQHYCHLNFSLRGNTTPYWIRSRPQLSQCTFVRIMHKVYCSRDFWWINPDEWWFPAAGRQEQSNFNNIASYNSVFRAKEGFHTKRTTATLDSQSDFGKSIEVVKKKPKLDNLWYKKKTINK